MIFAAAQTRPVKGNLSANLQQHENFIRKAQSLGADMIVFPELSLTGYEPALATELATTKEDTAFNGLQALSDQFKMVIAAGMPLRETEGISINLLIFQPHFPRQAYTKQFLHIDEIPFFSSKESSIEWQYASPEIALAICYEMHVPQHAEKVIKNTTDIYIASVAKTATGMDNGEIVLEKFARDRGIFCLLSNCIGPNDNFIGDGRSAVWSPGGERLAQLPSDCEGLVLLDTSASTARVVQM